MVATIAERVTLPIVPPLLPIRVFIVTSVKVMLAKISKCDVSQQITAVDGRYMLDILVVGKRVEFII